MPIEEQRWPDQGNRANGENLFSLSLRAEEAISIKGCTAMEIDAHADGLDPRVATLVAMTVCGIRGAGSVSTVGGGLLRYQF